ncbi:hypothetical protein MNBD_GAMMA13-1720 [hydrothermal vent metagenome]|uniref:Cupin type-2 domain-containing protein n=1 Tax=hydrothermal vent metagenome TaxID=652676 RepID=A0A3B0YQH0_9ZZZZ
MITNRILSCILILCSPAAVAEILLQSQTSWDDGVIYYPQGSAEIIAKKLSLVPGKQAAFHCHPVPTFGYILKGMVQVETEDGKKISLKQGDAVIEMMHTVHRGLAVGGPAEILVFYASAKGMPTTVLANAEAKEKGQCRD